MCVFGVVQVCACVTARVSVYACIMYVNSICEGKKIQREYIEEKQIWRFHLLWNVHHMWQKKLGDGETGRLRQHNSNSNSANTRRKKEFGDVGAHFPKRFFSPPSILYVHILFRICSISHHDLKWKSRRKSMSMFLLVCIPLLCLSYIYCDAYTLLCSFSISVCVSLVLFFYPLYPHLFIYLSEKFRERLIFNQSLD